MFYIYSLFCSINNENNVKSEYINGISHTQTHTFDTLICK